MLLPNYSFWRTLFKKPQTTRQSLAMYAETTGHNQELLNAVTQLLAGQYSQVLADLEEKSPKQLSAPLNWVALEASIYTGDMTKACEWFERMEHSAKTGEHYVIKALFYTYITMTFSQAKQTLALAKTKIEKDHLVQEEYQYRLHQIQMMQTIINMGG